MSNGVYDLRSAIELLKKTSGQLVETNVEVNPNAELSGVYRHVGAGGTVARPTQEGPAMIFNNVLGHPNAPVIIGLLASRKRVGLLLGHDYQKLGFLLRNSVKNAIDPVVVGPEKALCQEVVYKAEDEGFDIRKILPAPTNTPEDAGPYVTMGMCYGTDLETGEKDITIHRLCLQNKDEITMFFTPGARHLGAMREKYEAAGKNMPISISIGVDPAIEIGACFEPPTTPFGFNELSIAGALRGQAVEMVQCLTINEQCIAHAEYVIEGELVCGQTMNEDINSHTGKAMPEFPGYTGPSKDNLPVIKVKAITTRRNPIMQTCIGPSEEHVNMAGIPTEASIIDMVERAMPGRLQNVFAATPGGGKFLAVMQFKKGVPSDEGRQRQAALLAFSAFPELKNVILVDEDVDIFDMKDVMWAMVTRLQGDIDIINIPGVRCHPLDPSNDPACSWSIRDHGIACKTIYDATIPYNEKGRFQRAKFAEVDPKHWLPDFQA